MTFHYTTRRGDRGYLYADVLDLPGCTAMGSTPGELRDNVQLAVRWQLRADRRRRAEGSACPGSPPGADAPPFEVVEVTADGRSVVASAPLSSSSSSASSAGRTTPGRPLAPAGPTRIDYAVPGEVAAALPSTTYLPRADDGPFLTLGHRFNPGTRDWRGRAIASPRAIYLLKVRLHTRRSPIGYVQVALADPDDLRTCRVADLPDAVQSALDPRGRLAHRDVIVVARECVGRVSLSRVDNYVRVRIGPDRMTVFTWPFRGIWIGRFLRANGWAVNQTVVATAAPTFGFGYGRSEPPPSESMWDILRRLAYLAFGVLLILAILAKIFLRSSR